MDAPEFKLLVACCRASYFAGAAIEIERLSAHADWPAFLRLARRHRVQGLVAQAFYISSVSPPALIAEAMADDAVAIAEANLRCANTSIRLLEQFQRSSIPLRYVKGLSLSALAYDDPFRKMSSDIDILVAPCDIARSADALRHLGFRPIVPRDRPSVDLARWHRRHKESIWRSPDDAVVVELHSRLADHPALIPGIGMDSPQQLVQIGENRRLPTLSTSHLLSYLCVHGASSAWFRLKWIADFVALLNASGITVEDAYRDARRRGAGRAPAQALLLADGLSLLALPDGLKAELKSDPASRLLANVALRQLLTAKEPTQRLLGTATIHLSQALLLPGLKFKSAEISRQLSDILRWQR